MYKVINAFTDLQDNFAVYHTGDIYPRNGASVSDERIAELSTAANRLGYPLIAEVHNVNPDGEPSESVKKAVSRAYSTKAEKSSSKPTEAAKTSKKRQTKAAAEK